MKEKAESPKKSLVVKLFVGIALVTVGVLLAIWAMTALFSFSPFGTNSNARDTQVVGSITREDQVVLVSLGIQGIAEKNGNSEFFGIYVPGSDRTKFIQYNFNAKLGIEGKDVSIAKTGRDEFLVSIPKFIFIGHNNEEFRLVAENNGILSFVTPEIDTVDMVNKILSPTAQRQYLDQNEDILKDQAKAFYGGIIKSIDPTVKVQFEFRQ